MSILSIHILVCGLKLGVPTFLAFDSIKQSNVHLRLLIRYYGLSVDMTYEQFKQRVSYLA